MVRNMCRSYLKKEDGSKVSTQIITIWRITDKKLRRTWNS
jgi:hypothetical protein